MDKFKIKTISLYGFIILIVSSIISSGVIFYFLYNIYLSNQLLSSIKESHNEFLQLKVNTEKLLTSAELETAHRNWRQSVKNFDLKFLNLQQLKTNQLNQIDDLWYISKKEVNTINNIIKKNILNSKTLNNKPLLEKKGELFILKDTTQIYSTVLSLTQKITYLLQYEHYIIDEFKKLEKNNLEIINARIDNSIISSLIFPSFILIISIILILYILKRIKKIEDELVHTQFQLQTSYDDVRQANLLIKNIIDTIPVSIFWKDINGVYLGANKNFLRDMNCKTIDDLIEISKNDIDPVYSIYDDDVIKKDKEILNIEEIKSNGKNSYLLISKVPLKNMQGNIVAVLSSYLDITDKKEAQIELTKKERLLAQQSKMASMGEMLENIAHQWRQPLSVITTGASGIKLNKEYGILTDDMLLSTLESIEVSANHMSKTIDDFRDFFKVDKKLDYFNVNEAIDKSLFILSSKFKNRNIDVVENIQEIQAYGLMNEFIQSLMNILNNANDILENLKDEKKYIFIDMKVEDDRLIITVKDNAGGIPADTLPKIFEPYFTTKEGRKGTGIGLYMTKEMIENHMHGKVSAKNVQYSYEDIDYNGASFIIELPMYGDKT